MQMPRFTLRQLEMFVSVARTGSISRASEELQCSASAVSAGVTELERALHTQLCVRRKSRGVVLTPQGQLMHRLAQQLLADAAEVADQVDDRLGNLRGVLRLGCYAPLAATFLPPLLDSFSRAHPGVRVELFEGTQDDLVARTMSGDIELSMIYEPPDHPALQTLHILSRRPYVLVSGDDPLSARGRVSLAEMADRPLVMLDLPPSKHYTMAWFREVGILPNVRWQTHDLELLRALVARGLGYAVILQRQRRLHALDGMPLAAVEIDPPVTPVQVYMAYRPGPTPRRMGAFLDVVAKELASPPAWTGAVPARHEST